MVMVNLKMVTFLNKWRTILWLYLSNSFKLFVWYIKMGINIYVYIYMMCYKYFTRTIYIRYKYKLYVLHILRVLNYILANTAIIKWHTSQIYIIQCCNLSLRVFHRYRRKVFQIRSNSRYTITRRFNDFPFHLPRRAPTFTNCSLDNDQSH